MMKKLLFALTIVMSLAVTAQATVFDLYGGTTTSAAAAGTGANGAFRAQQFKPSDALLSTPSVMATSDTFRTVSMWSMAAVGVTGTVKLNVYAWNTNAATSVAGPVLGSSAVINLVPGAGPTEIKADLGSARAASGTYFAVLSLSNISGTGIDLNGIKSTTGVGSNQSAYHGTSANVWSVPSAREYAVTVDTTPEPAAALLLLCGAPLLIRRRRAQ
jgi:MYXO-CTERM domain-containing protein